LRDRVISKIVAIGSQTALTTARYYAQHLRSMTATACHDDPRRIDRKPAPAAVPRSRAVTHISAAMIGIGRSSGAGMSAVIRFARIVSLTALLNRSPKSITSFPSLAHRSADLTQRTSDRSASRTTERKQRATTRVDQFFRAVCIQCCARFYRFGVSVVPNGISSIGPSEPVATTCGDCSLPICPRCGSHALADVLDEPFVVPEAAVAAVRASLEGAKH